MSSAELTTTTINGYSISYHDNQRKDAPVVVFFPGWCHDHRAFDQLVPCLDADNRVIAINWRGHGLEPYPVDEFGYREQASDVQVLLDRLEVDTFLPVSHSHGGWPLLQVLENTGARRTPRAIVIDWLMGPPAPEFSAGLAKIQDPEEWRAGRQELFDVWLAGQQQERVRQHLYEEMTSYGFDMWAMAGRVIAGAYEEFGSPLDRMAGLSEPRPIRHLFSQPTDKTYQELQRGFGAQHPWYSFAMLGGPTHFPALDIPRKVAAHITEFAQGVSAEK